MSKKRIGAKVKAFIAHYFGDSQLNASDAATKAGYKHPRQAGCALLKKYAEEVDTERAKFAAKMEASAEEFRQRLTLIARADGHKDQLRAIEVGLKLTGQLSDKLNIKVDRAALEAEIVKTLGELGGSKSAPVPAIPLASFQ